MAKDRAPNRAIITKIQTKMLPDWGLYTLVT
jgi:hypothetical protein